MKSLNYAVTSCFITIDGLFGILKVTFLQYTVLHRSTTLEVDLMHTTLILTIFN